MIAVLPKPSLPATDESRAGRPAWGWLGFALVALLLTAIAALALARHATALSDEFARESTRDLRQAA